MYTNVATILSIAALSAAAPLSARAPGQYSNTTTTTYTPPPSSTSVSSIPPPTATQGQPIYTLLPDYTSQYHSESGAVDFHTARGLVSRSTSNNGADVTSLVTFMLPAQYASHQCQLVFDLTDPSSYTSGTQKAQLFTSLAPATASTDSWPSGNLRNQFLGTIDVVANGRATWEAGSGPGATTNGVFPCSGIAGQIYGGEVVPQGDNDVISWVAGVDGPKILVL